MEYTFDVIIVGSGLGGLCCGVMLAKEGYKVCILEKNRQIGGSLQTFVRDKVIFDSGVHYIGGLDKGQNLYKVFQYLGIMNKLKLKRLDQDAFDIIQIGKGGKIYKLAQGYDTFISQLCEYFPDEKKAIVTYCEKIQTVCSKFPLYNLTNGNSFEKLDVMHLNLNQYLDEISSNPELKAVLAGNSILFAGEPDKSPFYVHALIMNSFIQSAWKCINGGSQIARALYSELKKYGGVILRKTEVTELMEEEGKLRYAKTIHGDKYFAEFFISNIHPARTLEITKSSLFKISFKKRLLELSNTTSSLYVNTVIKPRTIRYCNHNLYYMDRPNAWAAIEYTEENWPGGFALFYTRDEKNPEYVSGITIMTYMHFQEVSSWASTFNTDTNPNVRSDSYEEFKNSKASILFQEVEKVIPGFIENILNYYVATPLSFRDYIGTQDGSLYGFLKDSKNPMKTLVSPRTKIPNLFFTGQNLNLHGILGVSLSSILTCSCILDYDTLLSKIRNVP